MAATDQADIVERLKDCALAMEKGLFGFGKPSFVPPTPGLIREAASVIEEQDAEIERLRAALASERERCAKVADQNLQDVLEPSPDPWDNGFASACKRIAASIRARGR